MYFHARSLSNKVVLLQNYASEYKPKVIAITETRAKPEIPDGAYALPGYTLLRADRCIKRGGGVMIYMKQDFISSQISLGSYSDFEFVACKLNVTKKDTIGILCIYRPPNITDTGDLDLVELMNNFLEQNFNFNIIIGDLNMPSVDWKLMKAPSKFQCFMESCEKHFLKQHVTESTRPNSKTVLDLVFTTV